MRTKTAEALFVGIMFGLIVMCGYAIWSVPQVVESYAVSGVHLRSTGQLMHTTAEGPASISGLFFTGLLLFKWFCISLIAVVFACVLYVILSSFGIVADLFEKIFVFFGRIYTRARNKVTPPVSVLETPIGNGQTLATLLNLIKQAVKENQIAVKQLQTLTAGMEPPPPPKTAAELLADKEKEMAELQAKLAQLEKQQKSESKATKAKAEA